MRRAFTLIEILVVIAIIVILVGLTTAGGIMMVKQATKTKCQTVLAKISTAIEAYRQDRATLPVPAVGYAAGDWSWVNAANAVLMTELLSKDNDHRGNPRKGYLIGEVDQAETVVGGVLVDVWGNPIIWYGPPWEGPSPLPGNASTSDFELWSAGPDGRFDDLRKGDENDADNDNIPARDYDPGSR
jgi:prepilin-type N-terminal cleavage/methylation domain-containing protein